jgi:hypothetical protein
VDHDPSVKPPEGTGLKLFLTGAAVTAGWYGAALGTSYLWTDSPGSRDLRIPVAGPVMALVDTGCGPKERPGCSKFQVVLRTIFTSLSAVGQVGGVLAMAESLFVPTMPANAVRGADTGSWQLGSPNRAAFSPNSGGDVMRDGASALTPVPVVFDNNGVGFGLVGQF